MNEAEWRAGFVIETHGSAETEALGRCCGELAPLGFAVTLKGDLGAGKTVFVRGLAQGLLAPGEAEVSSPTYVLQHVHRGGLATLYHIDAYRIEGGAGEFEASGLGECLDDARGVVCIEWPERVAELLPEDRLYVEIEHRGGDARLVHVLATGVRAGRIVDAMASRVGSRRQLRVFMGLEEPPRLPDEHPPSLS